MRTITIEIVRTRQLTLECVTPLLPIPAHNSKILSTIRMSKPSDGQQIRLGDEGIVVFVTNNSFIDGQMFDGMRKHLSEEFDTLYILDLGGNVRKGQAWGFQCVRYSGRCEYQYPCEIEA